MVFTTELKKLGLNDKEAAVYLTCLQLGPSPVQPIARKAKVVRATTYVILESLMEMGLVTRYKEGKKTLFAAEPPGQLGRLLEKEESVIQDKRRELEGLLPELQIMMKSAGDRPTVRYFQGIEGLHAMRQEIVMYTGNNDVVYNFTPIDYLNALFPENETSTYKQRAAKGIKGRTLLSTRSDQTKKNLSSAENARLTERRFIPPEKFPVPSGMTIYRDRIAIGKFAGKLGGVVIESQEMADMMRCLFDLAWQGAEKLQ
jgi:HTH-type transcriptional regulator, sugar sensing transcriptional regulator